MAKSKKKKKKKLSTRKSRTGKKRKKARADLEKSNFESATGSKAEASGETKEVRSRLTIRERLYGNNAAGIFQLASILPLFFGAWLAGGLVMAEVNAFISITVSAIAAHYTLIVKERPEVAFPKYFEMVSYVGQIFICFWVFQITASISIAVLTGFASVLVLLSGRIAPIAPWRVLTLALLLVVRMTVFGIIGMMSQLHMSVSTVIPDFGVLGLVPGTVLAAGLIAKHASVFEKAGWRRKRSVMTRRKDPETGERLLVDRPALLSAWYSSLMIIGPAIPIATAPLGFFPPSFLLVAVVFAKISGYCELFFHKKLSDESIAVGSANTSAVVSILLFIAGIIAQYI